MSPEKILLGHVWARTQGKRVRKCVCLCTMYDLLITCALRRFFRIINVCRDSFRAIIMMTAGYHGFLIRINGDISQYEQFLC